MGDSYKKLRAENAELRERVENLERRIPTGTIPAGVEEDEFVETTVKIHSFFHGFYSFVGQGDFAKGVEKFASYFISEDQEGHGKLLRILSSDGSDPDIQHLCSHEYESIKDLGDRDLEERMKKVMIRGAEALKASGQPVPGEIPLYKKIGPLLVFQDGTRPK